jgi:hypothetical protein
MEVNTEVRVSWRMLSDMTNAQQKHDIVAWQQDSSESH